MKYQTRWFVPCYGVRGQHVAEELLATFDLRLPTILDALRRWV